MNKAFSRETLFKNKTTSQTIYTRFMVFNFGGKISCKFRAIKGPFFLFRRGGLGEFLAVFQR